MNDHILIVEDDKDIVELLSLYLTSNGFRVSTASNGLDALQIVDAEDISLALVDIMMPKMNGYEFIQAVRAKKNLPIVILSAKKQEEDKVLGLDLGADAYLTKPFSPFEVIAYIKALLRRSYEFREEARAEEATSIAIGDLDLDTEKLILRKRGQIVALTSAELKIVLMLMRNPGQVFTKSQLYEYLGSVYYEADDNTMMVHISHIRAKIEDDPSNPIYIKTVRGLGYRLEVSHA